MGWSTTSSFDATGVSAEQVWRRAYADPRAWPEWNDRIKSVEPDGEPFEVGGRNRLRLSPFPWRICFTLTEVEANRVFTDEGPLPGAVMGHRHTLEPIPGGVRFTNTLYTKGPLAWFWGLGMAWPVRRGLPRWQHQAAELARGQD
jgi:hypothetical protein